MATTTNFGWETPDDTDLVKDGAAAIRTALGGVDTSFVDLKGGTTGQVLAKASATDLDFSWVAVDPLTILDAKGDLITATAADTPARLAVGTNGQTLVADSSTATGLKWATPASGTTFSGVSLSKSTVLSVATATATAISFDTEAYDTDNYHSNVTNPTRITIPAGKTGYYQLNVQATWDTSAGGGSRELRIYKNGSAILYGYDVYAPSGQYPGSTITQNLYLTAADYIEVYVIQRSGSNLNLLISSTEGYVQMNYLGA